MAGTKRTPQKGTRRAGATKAASIGRATGTCTAGAGAGACPYPSRGTGHVPVARHPQQMKSISTVGTVPIWTRRQGCSASPANRMGGRAGELVCGRAALFSTRHRGLKLKAYSYLGLVCWETARDFPVLRRLVSSLRNRACLVRRARSATRTCTEYACTDPETARNHGQLFLLSTLPGGVC